MSESSVFHPEGLIEVGRLTPKRHTNKISSMSTGSETTKSRNTDLGKRVKTLRMLKPSPKIFSIRRPEFAEPVFDPLLTDKYKKIQSIGPILLEDRSTYEGQIKHKLRYGFGEWVGTDGSMYEGYWDNDKKNGLGRLFMSNGEVYDGCWANDLMQGQGRLYTSDSEFYEGSFENGVKNGLGKQYLKDGSYFEGTWKEDRKAGEGWYYSAETKKKTQQVWSLDNTQFQ